jgi:hypothetical protein
LDTRRFASALLRAASPLATGVATFRLAGGGERGNTLARALDEIEQADVVICADSFAAHAAPVLGCTTFVLASPGLENWRVPSKRSFYFDAAEPPETVGLGIRQVLSHLRVGPAKAQQRLAPTQAERRLRTAIDGLGRLLEQDGQVSFEAWQAELVHMIEASAGLEGRLPSWPEPARGLVADHNLAWAARAVDEIADMPPEFRTDVLHYWQSQCQELNNSNLYKYLALITDEPGNDPALSSSGGTALTPGD